LGAMALLICLVVLQLNKEILKMNMPVAKIYFIT